MKLFVGYILFKINRKREKMYCVFFRLPKKSRGFQKYPIATAEAKTYKHFRQ